MSELTVIETVPALTQQHGSITDQVAEVHRLFNATDKAEANACSSRRRVGCLLLELRQQVEAGLDGDAGWLAWCAKNIKRSIRDIQRVMKLAHGPVTLEGQVKEIRNAKDRATRVSHRVAMLAPLTLPHEGPTQIVKQNSRRSGLVQQRGTAPTVEASEIVRDWDALDKADTSENARYRKGQVRNILMCLDADPVVKSRVLKVQSEKIEEAILQEWREPLTSVSNVDRLICFYESLKPKEQAEAREREWRVFLFQWLRTEARRRL